MNRSAFIVAALVLIASSFTSVLAAESEPRVTVIGDVITENGKPLAGATVQFVLVTRNGKHFTVTTTTNENGKYAIKGLPMSKGRAEVLFRDRVAAQLVLLEQPVNEVRFVLEM